MKKVLLITYYWPPSGGAGVQRCLKLVKYFRSFGWEPIVYTAADAAYPILDPSLARDVPEGQVVLQGPIWEPYEWYKRFTGKGKQEQVYSGFLAEGGSMSFSAKAAIWLRGNFFIPDARCFWIRPSITYLTRWLHTHPVDAIVSSGPPHTVHMIARGVKQATGLPWVADFRDPWTKIDFYDQLMLTRWADWRHHHLERQVLRDADRLTTVSWTWAREFAEMGVKDPIVINNGFDEEDIPQHPPAPEPAFTCSHIGYLNSDRNPVRLWEAFAALCEEIPGFRAELRLRFIGKTDHITFQQLEQLGLMDRVEVMPYMPHAEVLDYTCSSQVLLLLVNNVPNVMGHIPGKTFEYIASRRPVLAIGPETADFARVIRETSSGLVCGFEDAEGIKKALRHYYQQYRAGTLYNETADITSYSRKHQTGQMAEVLNSLTQA
ncbi:MAG: glycosyltransferase [Bacteroidia bacterium]|nr:glycosyltransferase [Bacteroidia bacterium]